MMETILVTGSAGFIGYHVVKELLLNGYTVIGLDNLNKFYDVNLKYGRLNELGIIQSKIKYNKYVESTLFDNHKFILLDLNDSENLRRIFQDNQLNKVINLAAQTGVRSSLDFPQAYIDSNVSGFLNILENCRNSKISHLIFASSSSVYGLNTAMPYSVTANVDHPISLYAATKKANELMAHTYSYLFNVPVTGLRFFTVYGEWGRPDMSYFLFTKAIYEGKPINVFNNGEMERDFTYIDDIVNGILKILDNPPKSNLGWSTEVPDPSTSVAPYKLYNLGNSKPVKLLDFIKEIERVIGVKAKINFLPLQPGDVVSTWADVSGLFKDYKYRPKTAIGVGIPKFVEWYNKVYQQLYNEI